jgi:nucleotide-binding universal stress UspA family protein
LVLIVHVIGGYGLPDTVFRHFTHAQQAWLKEQLESVSTKILNAARDRARSIGIGTILLESHTGDVAQTIVEIAQEKNVENIVVGKRGVGRIAGLLLGSISQKIVSLAPRPVTVIP